MRGLRPLHARHGAAVADMQGVEHACSLQYIFMSSACAVSMMFCIMSNMFKGMVHLIGNPDIKAVFVCVK